MSVASRHTDTAAQDAAKLLVRLGLAILMIGLPCSGVFSRGAIYVLLPIGAVLILLGALLDAPLEGARKMGNALATPLAAAILFLVFWSGLSLAWTPFPAPAIERFLKIVGPTLLAAVVAASLPQRTKPFDLYLLPVGLAATAVLTLALAFLGPPSFWRGLDFDDVLFERSIITLIVLVWPALGALSLREHWIAAAILAVLVATVALAGFAQIALAAMGAAAFTFAVAMSSPGKVARALAFIFSFLILLAPAIPFVSGLIMRSTGIAGAALVPMQVWADIVAAHWPRLITGHGFDTANYGPAMGFLPVETPKSVLFVLWYELGAIGAAAFALLAALTFSLAGQAPSIVAPALLAGLVAVSTIAVVGIATAQIWWVTLVDCGVIAAALLLKGSHRTQRPDAAAIEAIDDAAEPDTARAARP